jgi:small subunit ribosomal protein S15
MAKINKSKVIEEFKNHDKDTGSSEVQIAVLSAKIQHLSLHLQKNRKDFHSRRGLIAMTARRRKLLDYLKRNDLNKYQSILSKLNLRK